MSTVHSALTLESYLNCKGVSTAILHGGVLPTSVVSPSQQLLGLWKLKILKYVRNICSPVLSCWFQVRVQFYSESIFNLFYLSVFFGVVSQHSLVTFLYGGVVQQLARCETAGKVNFSFFEILSKTTGVLCLYLNNYFTYSDHY